MLGTDGDEHRRLKDALQPTFSPSSAGSWTNTRLPQLCDELLDEFDASGTDVMTAYAEPIAVIVLQDVLGWDERVVARDRGMDPWGLHRARQLHERARAGGDRRARQ